MKGGLRRQRHLSAGRSVVLHPAGGSSSARQQSDCQNALDMDGLRSLATESGALGDRYFTGQGGPQDNGKAIRCFRIAVDWRKRML